MISIGLQLVKNYLRLGIKKWTFTKLIYSSCQSDNQHKKVTNLIHKQYCHWSFQNSCLCIEVAPCVFRKRVPKNIKNTEVSASIYSFLKCHLVI